MTMAQSKKLKNDYFQNIFCQFQKWNEQVLYLSHPTNYAMFHPQTTEIQPFKVECFPMKMLKLQQYVSQNCEILFGIWNSHDMII